MSANPQKQVTDIRDRVIEMRRVGRGEVLPHPNNFRTHPEPQREAFRGILREVGIAGAGLAYHSERNGGRLTFIDGHLRDEEIPERFPVLITDLNDAEADLLLSTYDPLAAMAGADAARLDSLLREVSTGEAAVQEMLSKLAEDNGLYFGEGKKQEDESTVPALIDRAAELQKAWDTKSGQLWEIPSVNAPQQKHRLLIGDCTEKADVGRLCAGKRASLVVTSPPYNQKLDQFTPSGMHREHNWVSNVQKGSYFDSKPEEQYQREQIDALRLWAEYLTPDGSIFYNHKNRYREKCVISPLKWIEETGAKLRQEIIWKRPGSVTQNARMFLPCDERVYWLYFGDDFYFDDTTEHKTWSSVWEINPHVDAEESMHGCAFPLELALRPIRACSRLGDVILEPYCGSGTTTVAAEQDGRVCYAAEISEAYSAVTLERMSALGLKPELAEG